MRNKKLAIAAIALVVVIGLMLGVWMTTRPETEAGSKAYTVTVVHKDGTVKDFAYRTDAEYLAEVLLEAGLAEGEQSSYGLFIQTVDGETADNNNQEWWCITKGGEQVNSGADTLPIADGDQFELTLMEGY